MLRIFFFNIRFYTLIWNYYTKKNSNGNCVTAKKNRNIYFFYTDACEHTIHSRIRYDYKCTHKMNIYCSCCSYLLSAILFEFLCVICHSFTHFGVVVVFFVHFLAHVHYLFSFSIHGLLFFRPICYECKCLFGAYFGYASI